MQLREDAILEDYETDIGFLSLLDQYDQVSEKNLRVYIYALLSVHLSISFIALIVVIVVQVTVARFVRNHNDFLRRLNA
jgi:hypothetical protein